MEPSQAPVAMPVPEPQSQPATPAVPTDPLAHDLAEARKQDPGFAAELGEFKVYKRAGTLSGRMQVMRIALYIIGAIQISIVLLMLIAPVPMLLLLFLIAFPIAAASAALYQILTVLLYSAIVFNMIALPIYAHKRDVHGKHLILPVLSFLLSGYVLVISLVGFAL